MSPENHRLKVSTIPLRKALPKEYEFGFFSFLLFIFIFCFFACMLCFPFLAQDIPIPAMPPWPRESQLAEVKSVL